MKIMSKITADVLEINSIVSNEDKDIVAYGLDIFFSSLLELLAIFVISAVVGNFIETLLYFVSFIPLRLYAGGYHADTKLKCFLVSLLVYALFTVTTHLLPVSWSIPAIITSLAFTLTMVILFAPIIHFNKSIGNAERKVYRKFSLIIAFVETAVILLLTILSENKIYSLSLSLGQLGVSVTVALAVIKKRLTGK